MVVTHRQPVPSREPRAGGRLEEIWDHIAYYWLAHVRRSHSLNTKTKFSNLASRIRKYPWCILAQYAYISKLRAYKRRANLQYSGLIPLLPPRIIFIHHESLIYFASVCSILSVFPGQRGRAAEAGAGGREAARRQRPPWGTATRAARRGPEARRGRAGGGRRRRRRIQLDLPPVVHDEVGRILAPDGGAVAAVAPAVLRQSGAVVPRGAPLAAHPVQQRPAQLGLQQRLEPLPSGRSDSDFGYHY